MVASVSGDRAAGSLAARMVKGHCPGAKDGSMGNSLLYLRDQVSVRTDRRPPEPAVRLDPRRSRPQFRLRDVGPCWPFFEPPGES